MQESVLCVHGVKSGSRSRRSGLATGVSTLRLTPTPVMFLFYGSICATLETEIEGELSLVCHRVDSRFLENVGLQASSNVTSCVLKMV